MIDRSTLDGRRGPPAPPGSLPPPMTAVCSLLCSALLCAARRAPHPRGTPPASSSLGPGEMSHYCTRRPRSIAGCSAQTGIVPLAHPYRPQSTPDGTLWLLGANTITMNFATAARRACPRPMVVDFLFYTFPMRLQLPSLPPSSSNVSQRPTAREDKVTPPWAR